MRIKRQIDAIIKELEKEIRWYYLFNDFEVIITELEPGDEQNKHLHKKISEIYYVISGEVEFHFEKDYSIEKLILKKGDLILFEPGEIHNLKNISNNRAVTITFKKINESSDYSDIFKTDKFK